MIKSKSLITKLLLVTLISSSIQTQAFFSSRFFPSKIIKKIAKVSFVSSCVLGASYLCDKYLFGGSLTKSVKTLKTFVFGKKKKVGRERKKKNNKDNKDKVEKKPKREKIFNRLPKKQKPKQKPKIDFAKMVEQERKRRELQKAKELADQKAKEAEKKAKEKKECGICFDDEKGKEEYYRFSCCGHEYCKGCLMGMVNIALKERNTKSLQCPNPECKQKFSHGAIKAITYADDQIMEAIGNIQMQEWIAKRPGAKNCPTPDCKFCFLNPEDDAQTINCWMCRTIFCSKCLGAHSTKLTCKQFKDGVKEKDVEFERLEKLNEEWKRNNTKVCPKCKANFQKIEGCDHITCKCGHHFCYRCGANWDMGVYGCSKRCPY